jgi:hypothetical protein
MNRNLYVSDRDVELWAWIERYAYEHRMSVSAIVMLACERFRNGLDRDDDGTRSG